MAYTTTTKQSYGNRVSKSFKGIGSGILLFIIGTVLLFWNEGRTVKVKRALNQAEDVTVEMPDISRIDPQFEGKMIHATGDASTSEILTDGLFGISLNAINLSRNVEYYQWTEQSKEEKKEKIGGGQEITTTYTYSKKWVSSPVNSSEFADPAYRDTNFVLTTIEDNQVVADLVDFGAYKLPPFLKHGIRSSEQATPQLTDEMIKEWNDLLWKRDSAATVAVSAGQAYFGRDVNNPDVGDVRVTFGYTPTPQTVSILAVVIGDTFGEFVAKNGKNVSRIELGAVPAAKMYDAAQKENKIIAWIVRILAVILIIAGLKGIFNFLSTVFAVVPLIRRILAAGINFVCTVVGLIWSLLIFVIAWISYRPALGITFLVIIAALIVLLVMRSKKRKNTPADMPA